MASIDHVAGMIDTVADIANQADEFWEAVLRRQGRNRHSDLCEGGCGFRAERMYRGQLLPFCCRRCADVSTRGREHSKTCTRRRPTARVTLDTDTIEIVGCVFLVMTMLISLFYGLVQA